MDYNIITHLLAIAIIYFYALYRFDTPPSARLNAEAGGAKLVLTLRQWFQLNEPPCVQVYPPPRANTTAFKFWLYRSTYVLIGIGLFELARDVPAVKDALAVIVTTVDNEASQLVKECANDIVLAFMIVVFTRIPPLRGADAAIRRALYERACIPAKQLEFQRSLRNAEYRADAYTLEKVRGTLEVDGFDKEDIVFEPNATARSLWTKISLVMAQLQIWGTNDRYTTAFAILHEPGSEIRSVDRLQEAYHAMMGDARTCLAALRHAPEAEETQLRTTQFRQECKALLDAIYALLARIALRSHYCYGDAITAVRSVGFEVNAGGSQLPNKHDMVALIMLLFMVITLPLGLKLGLGKALTITVIYLLAILAPIYLAAEWPNLLMRDRRNMPPVAFPLLSALLAGALGFVVIVAVGTVFPNPDEVCAHQSLFICSLNRWLSRSYPWTILICGLSGVLAVLMLVGRYPDVDNLHGAGCYRQWVSLTDALVLAGFILVLMVLVVLPRLTELSSHQYGWGALIRPVVAAFSIGLVVPTWFRGNARQIREERRQRESGGSSADGSVPAMP